MLRNLLRRTTESGSRWRGDAPTGAPAPDVRRSRPQSAEEALAALVRGNGRFVAGEMLHPRSAASFRAGLQQGQQPFATIVGCSDSRVPPELIFDEGFGDLFVVRVAGNIIDTDVTASVEYAVDHLRTPLVVVLGHELCGAVTAAVQHARGELTAEPPEIVSLLKHIEAGLSRLSADAALEQAVREGVEHNVRHAMSALLVADDVQRAVSSGQARVVGAVYDLHSGVVRYLP